MPPHAAALLPPCSQVMGSGTALAKMLPPSDVYLNSSDW